jgi:hypothetical protein
MREAHTEEICLRCAYLGRTSLVFCIFKLKQWASGFSTKTTTVGEVFHNQLLKKPRASISNNLYQISTQGKHSTS